jgi:hypothetical protein
MLAAASLCSAGVTATEQCQAASLISSSADRILSSQSLAVKAITGSETPNSLFIAGQAAPTGNAEPQGKTKSSPSKGAALVRIDTKTGAEFSQIYPDFDFADDVAVSPDGSTLSAVVAKAANRFLITASATDGALLEPPMFLGRGDAIPVFDGDNQVFAVQTSPEGRLSVGLAGYPLRSLGATMATPGRGSAVLRDWAGDISSIFLSASSDCTDAIDACPGFGFTQLRRL